jgi:hypothetical protein
LICCFDFQSDGNAAAVSAAVRILLILWLMRFDLERLRHIPVCIKSAEVTIESTVLTMRIALIGTPLDGSVEPASRYHC